VNWSHSEKGLGISVPSIWSDAQHMGLAASVSSAQPGDLIIFPNESHVGIVASRNGNTITTVEGNSGNAVRSHTYNLGQEGFVGVVHPPASSAVAV
jgi:cell wall-associated NlpC family hydrolase